MQQFRSNLALDAAAANIVRKLGGVWQPHGAMCLCPAHEDSTPSLSVRVGDRSLLFKCFAGCDARDVFRAIRRLRLDVPVDVPATITAPSPSNLSRLSSCAREIWDSAVPLAGTPAEGYLASRGIFIASDALRFHPRTPIGRGRNVRFRPALIAAVRLGGRVIGIQRIFLDAEASCLAPDLLDAKLTLGRPLAGAVMLQPPGPILGLAEGVETALSAAILLGIPVWAALGNERLHQIALPPVMERLILLPDNDAGGRLGERRAREAYLRDDRHIDTIWPWGDENDWNDVLQHLPRIGGGEGVNGRVRLAA
jgi:hypothetical protein